MANLSPQPNKSQSIWQKLAGEVNGFSLEQIKIKRQNAVTWFQEFIKKHYNTNGRSPIQETFQNARFTKVHFFPEFGKLYTFKYDPKTKETLPFYDTFPLVFVLETYGNESFLGLNLHYLSHKDRLILFERMNDYKVVDRSSRYQNNTRLLINYDTLKKSPGRFPLHRACIRSYLTRNMRSNLIRIEEHDWITALFLPTERFEKRSKQLIQTESKKFI